MQFNMTGHDGFRGRPRALCHTWLLCNSEHASVVTLQFERKQQSRKKKDHIPVKVFPHQNVKLLELCLIE